MSSESLVSNGLSLVGDLPLECSEPRSQRAKVVHIGTVLLQDEQWDPNIVLDLFALVRCLLHVKLTGSLIASLKTDTPVFLIWRQNEGEVFWLLGPVNNQMNQSLGIEAV